MPRRGTGPRVPSTPGNIGGRAYTWDTGTSKHTTASDHVATDGFAIRQPGIFQQPAAFPKASGFSARHCGLNDGRQVVPCTGRGPDGQDQGFR